MKYTRPIGTETEEPPGLNRHESISWWCEWKLARWAESNRTGFGAIAQYHFVENPTRACAGGCKVGSKIEDGQLRTCETCRGLGYERMSLDEIRDEYRAIRARVCEARDITPECFHEETAAIVARQPGLTSPGFWLAAARKIEDNQLRERAARRQATRSRW